MLVGWNEEFSVVAQTVMVALKKKSAL